MVTQWFFFLSSKLCKSQANSLWMSVVLQWIIKLFIVVTEALIFFFFLEGGGCNLGHTVIFCQTTWKCLLSVQSLLKCLFNAKTTSYFILNCLLNTTVKTWIHIVPAGASLNCGSCAVKSFLSKQPLWFIRRTKSPQILSYRVVVYANRHINTCRNQIQ